MKIPTGLKIAVLTIAATGFYTYVGQLVPQKEVLPPQETEMSAEMTSDELVQVGRQLMEGKGMCLTCHTVGKSGALRFPDLAGMGSRADTRIEGMSGVEYLAQSLWDPNAYIVPGFNPGMPAIDKQPIGLNDQEMLAVIAYLQSLGGEVTVTMETRLSYMEGGAAESAPAAPAAASAAPAPAPASGLAAAPAPAAAGGASLLQRFNCSGCHHLDQAGTLKGPSLSDVGARRDEAAIFSALVSARGGHQDAPYLQTATIDDLRKIAGILAQKKGAQ